MQPEFASRSLLMPPGAWLDDVLVPWWREHIVDPQGGYFEALAADGSVDVGTRRTTLNQARLTYVFSHAAIRTGDALSLRAAAHGFEFLRRRRRDAATGGWFRAVDVAGGFVEKVGIGPKPRPRFRRQNPHMHLLEACLAWHAPPQPSFAASPGSGQDDAANAVGHQCLPTGELP